jgi:hypothetical protein
MNVHYEPRCAGAINVVKNESRAELADRSGADPASRRFGGVTSSGSRKRNAVDVAQRRST